MNIKDITMEDLLKARATVGYPYRHRRLVGSNKRLLTWHPDPQWYTSQDKANYRHLQESWAKETGVRHDNHQVVEVRLEDGTPVSVMFTDWNLIVAEASAHVPPEKR